MEENKVTAEERLIGILEACTLKEYTDYKYLVDDDKIVVEQEIKRNIFYGNYTDLHAK